jgi:dipeptidyl aminopeptidase/acylaminoacyl peptidase
MELLFYHPESGPTPVPSHFARGESVRFNSADGTRLHGWFIPGGVDPRACATIVHVHGNAGNIESHIGFTDYLPAAGFNLFIFDYRGYGESEGSAHSRKPLIADTVAALDVLLARADVDPSRIGMYGQSLGGSIGLNVMADRPQIRAAVFESAFTSWRDIAATVLGGGDPGAISRTLSAILIDDSCRADDAIARIDRPILLLHGDGDSIVPIQHSRKLAAAATSENVRLIELPGGDHNSLRDTHPEVEQLVIDFFKTNLAPDSP